MGESKADIKVVKDELESASPALETSRKTVDEVSLNVIDMKPEGLRKQVKLISLGLAALLFLTMLLNIIALQAAVEQSHRENGLLLEAIFNIEHNVSKSTK